MSPRAWLSLGSNVSRERNFSEALKQLGRRCSILRESRRYDSPAVGSTGPNFLNSVVEIETAEPPSALFEICRDIEASLGRRRGEDKNAPRPIDIDILLYENHVVTDSGFQIPYPGMENYGFVMVPLAELIPDAVHPVLGKTIHDLAAALPPFEGAAIS